MAQVTITQLPQAQPLAGTESVPISQNGQTVQTTVAAIANSPTQQQTFITVNTESTLPNSRSLQGGTGVGLTDTGALGSISIILNGASGSLETSVNGMIAKTSGSTVVGRTLTGSSTGVAVTNGDGVAGNPVIALNGPVGSINGLAGSGLLTLQNGSSVGSVQITGTAGEIAVADGNGLLGNPTISLEPTGVSAGSYTNSSITVDATGRITAASSGAGAVTSISVVAPLQTTGGSTPTLSITQAGAATNGYLSSTDWNTFNGKQDSLGTGTTNQILTWGSAPQWTNPALITVGNATAAVTATTAQNLADGAANRIAYQSASATTTFIVAPTVSDTFLKWTGSAFQWGTIAGTGTVTSVDASGGTTGLTFTGGPITTSGSLTLGGTLTVANGGTGATSLTGYVKGNGSSAFTAAATIPNTDITGLGTMSTQAANSVAITGGNINGTTIGGTTPAAGTFTSVAMTTGTITTPPSSGNDIVNKTYADAIASGINFHESCKYATTAALAANTYNNGTGGVGATLTGNVNGALTVDGYTFASPADNGTRILVKNESNAAHNGVYTLSAAGSAGGPYILIRATDFDTAGTGVDQINQGDFFLIISGTANANTSWVQQTPLPITVGTTGITFTQFGAPLTYSAGTGLSESPAYTFNIANTTVAAGTYGGAATAVTLAINAQGQITSATDVSIAIAASAITSGTVDSARISGSYTGITGVGTLTAGTWNATTIGVAYGGTGLTSYTAGDLIYASGSTTLSKLALGTNTYVLVAGASAPQYVAQSTLSVGSAATATSAGSVANSVTFNDSGTGAASGVAYDGSVVRTISYNTIGAPSTSGTNATGTWNISISGNAATATSATSATSATTATNVSGGAAGSLVYQSAISTTTTLPLGTTNFVLTAGASAPQYVAQSTLSVGSATTATNATNVATTLTSTNADFYIPFVAAASSSNQGLGVDAGITYNPSTNAITAGISGGTF
jgi:hypothetical protein